MFSLLHTCADHQSEIACAADVDSVLSPGSYYLVVDGSGPNQFGRFSFEWHTQDVSAQEGACKAAPALVDGQTVRATSSGVHRFNQSCAGREDGQASPDRIYRGELKQRARLHLALATQGWDGAVSIRKACLDPPHATSARAAESGCSRTDSQKKAKIDTTLDAGTYYVVVGGQQSNNQGAFTLEFKVDK